MLLIGQIIKSHGIKGELKVKRLTDFPERFDPGNTVYLSQGEGYEAVEIEAYKEGNKYSILKLVGLESIDEAEKLKGTEIKIKKSQTTKLPENTYYYHEIIGCDVYTDDATYLGVVDSILAPGANDVWVVKSPTNEEYLIPYIPQVVKQVDILNERIEVELMEGLI